jgi:hypothetical protein
VKEYISEDDYTTQEEGFPWNIFAFGFRNSQETDSETESLE